MLIKKSTESEVLANFNCKIHVIYVISEKADKTNCCHEKIGPGAFIRKK